MNNFNINWEMDLVKFVVLHDMYSILARVDLMFRRENTAKQKPQNWDAHVKKENRHNLSL